MFMCFLFCGVSNSMLVAPPAPASLWMLFMLLFSWAMGSSYNIPSGLLQEEGWGLWICWKSAQCLQAVFLATKGLRSSKRVRKKHRVTLNVLGFGWGWWWMSALTVYLVLYEWFAISGLCFWLEQRGRAYCVGELHPWGQDCRCIPEIYPKIYPRDISQRHSRYPRQQNWCLPFHLEIEPKRRTK